MVDINNVDFWFRTFKPRTKGWQTQNLKSLRGIDLRFGETKSEREEKIRALEILLGKR